MRILFAGQFKEWSLEHHFVNYFKTTGAEAHIHPIEDYFDDYYHRNIWNKLKFRGGVSQICERLNKDLVAEVKRIKPDIVWVFKGMRVLPAALREIKKMGIKLVNYNPDHPFFFSSKGSGNANVTKSIDLYDLHLCYDKRVAAKIEKDYGIPTEILPFGFQLPIEYFNEIKDEPEINTACFIGTCDSIRVKHVKEVASHGISIHVFGHNWDKMLPEGQENVTVHPPTYQNEFWRNMRKYRLQLNIFRPHNIGSHNMRTFEVPAVGGIMLTPDSDDQRSYFEPDKEIFMYRSKSEMIEKAKYILSMPAEEAAKICHNARQRSLKSDYSYEGRARKMHVVFTALLKEGTTITNLKGD